MGVCELLQEKTIESSSELKEQGTAQEISLALEQLIEKEFETKTKSEIKKILIEEEEKLLENTSEEILETSYSHFGNYLVNEADQEDNKTNNEYIGYKLNEQKEEYIPVEAEVQNRVEKQIDKTQQATEWGFQYVESYDSTVQEVQTKIHKAINMTFVMLVYELKESGHWTNSS